MHSVPIKAVEGSDFARWSPLWKSYQRFYRADLPEAVTLATWARFLDPAEPMNASLAVAGEQAVSLVHSIFHSSTGAAGDYCYFQDLFVADDAPGSGIGRALIEDAYAEVRRLGAARLYWMTQESNHDAVQLYDRVADRPGVIVYRKHFA